MSLNKTWEGGLDLQARFYLGREGSKVYGIKNKNSRLLSHKMRSIKLRFRLVLN